MSRDPVSEEKTSLPNDKEIVEIKLATDQLEGTTAKVANWLVDVGGYVEQGAPVLELETDKVTMEVNAPVSGVLLTQEKQANDEIGEASVLGKLEAGEATNASLTNSSQVETATAQPLKIAEAGIRSSRHLIGPAVRRLLDENKLNIEQISGSGLGGRVTKNDVIEFVNVAASTKKTNEVMAHSSSSAKHMVSRFVPHTAMRKAIASHMVESLLHTSPHVTSVFEMDMSSIIEHRSMCKMGFIEAGVKLTFTAYFLAATAKAMQEVPVMNARFHEEALEIFEDINIGIGTALGDEGLVVPVVKQVQDKNLFEIAKALQQQTDRARHGKLTAADMKDGTFTISNHGVSGSLFAAPIIINQPEVAILGIGKLEKRAVVESIDGEDMIKIRPKCYVSLSIDHRAVDAYQTNLFLSHFVETIESWGK
ncbi:MAG: 2-oxo acid dehydrogenase subunit E2 [Amphritea sp.]|nr:2-oxo acid dehydrogenase subunit E2 [Amphritea sp.]